MIAGAANGAGEGGALLTAARWMESLVQGPAATTLAVLAVAATGLMMLSGRLPVRRGLVVALGCFVLFGAPTIARGLFAAAGGMPESGVAPAMPIAAAVPPPAYNPPSPPRQAADPYAGASIIR